MSETMHCAEDNELPANRVVIQRWTDPRHPPEKHLVQILPQLLDTQAGDFLDFIMLFRQMLQHCLQTGHYHFLPNPFQLNIHSYLTTLFNVMQPLQIKVLFHIPLKYLRFV